MKSGIIGLAMGVAALGMLTLALAPNSAQSQTAPPSARGQALYVELGCVACHGEAGRGDRGPRLAATRMTRQAFTTAVRTPAADMPPYPADFVSDADVAAIHTYLAGLR